MVGLSVPTFVIENVLNAQSFTGRIKTFLVLLDRCVPRHKLSAKLLLIVLNLFPVHTD